MKRILLIVSVLLLLAIGCSPQTVEIEQKQESSNQEAESLNIDSAEPGNNIIDEQADNTSAEAALSNANYADFTENFELALPDQSFNYENIELPAHFLTEAVTALDNTPANNPTTDEGATLGRVLFYDVSLSSNFTTSCASCHKQAYAFADPLRFSAGFTGSQTGRHSPGITNVRYYPNGKYFWDERANSLEEQALMPIIDFVEMGLSLPELEDRVRTPEYYPALFEAAFGDQEVTGERISFALAQFMRSMISYESIYDEGVANNFENFSELEQQGMELFNGKAGCSECHDTHLQVSTEPRNNGLDLTTTDPGVGQITGISSDNGVFKAPSLRNIGLTAPYMHDGRFRTLYEVVQFYNENVQDHPNLADELTGTENLGQPEILNLDITESSALVFFLHTLTDSPFVTDEKFSNPFVSLNDRVLAGDEASDGGSLENAGTPADSRGTTYVVNSETSSISWSGSKPIGVAHTGTVDLASGNLVIENDALISGNFTIDMDSIKEDDNEVRLEQHLRTTDFFNVAEYPEAYIEIIEVTPTDNPIIYVVRADLTIKSITNEITFSAFVFSLDENSFNSVATISIDRTLWDIRFGSAAFFSGLGDAMINDTMVIDVSLSAYPMGTETTTAPESESTGN